MAATQGLSHMISDCKKLFQVSNPRPRSGEPPEQSFTPPVRGRAQLDTYPLNFPLLSYQVFYLPHPYSQTSLVALNVDLRDPMGSGMDGP